MAGIGEGLYEERNEDEGILILCSILLLYLPLFLRVGLI